MSGSEVENKKNSDSLSLPCYPVNRSCLPRKILIEKEKKTKERKKKNRDKTQTKLNAPQLGIM